MNFITYKTCWIFLGIFEKNSGWKIDKSVKKVSKNRHYESLNQFFK